MEEMTIQHDPEERRIFICVSKIKLKTVLLNDGHVKSPISLDHSLAQKETFVIMLILLNAFNYNNSCWQIHGYLKVTGLLLGLQTGCTKFSVVVGESSNRKMLHCEEVVSQRESGSHNIKFLKFSFVEFWVGASASTAHKAGSYEEISECLGQRCWRFPLLAN
jgi:hypothetical protein